MRTASDMDLSAVVANVFLNPDCGSVLTNGVEDDEGSAGSAKGRGALFKRREEREECQLTPKIAVVVRGNEPSIRVTVKMGWQNS